MIAETPLAERQLECDTGLYGTSAPGGATQQSTLSALEERYIAITNQYAVGPKFSVRATEKGIIPQTF